MSLNFRIRRAHSQDLEAVIALERRTANAPHWAEPDYGMIVEGNPNPALQRCLLVAEQESGNQLSDLIGFAVCKVIGAEIEEARGELESIVVSEQARRLGVGSALCAAALQWCRDLKIPNVGLEVRPSNTGAIGFYTDLGFIPIGLRKRYYQDPDEDAVLMQIAVFQSQEEQI